MDGHPGAGRRWTEPRLQADSSSHPQHADPVGSGQGYGSGVKFRNDIQGLRAVAVLLVILAHVGIPGFDGGWIGVDVFFVISGFLITGLLSKEYGETRNVSFSQFYLRRAKRILPAAIVTILVVVVAGELLLNSIRASGIRTDAFWSLGFSANINLIRQSTDYFADGQAVSPLQHFWSLAVEEQFYLFWPGIFLLVARQQGLAIRKTWITENKRIIVTAGLISALSLLWSISYTASNPSSAYFSTLTRIWELGFGALLSVLTPRLNVGLNRVLPEKNLRIRAIASWGGLMAILVGACLVIKPGDPFPGWLALVPVLGAVSLIFGGQGDGKAPLPNRVLALQPLPFIGLISFSLYLWHWPVHVFADALYPDSFDTPAGKALQLGVIALLSLVSYWLVERPARRSHFGNREPVKNLDIDAPKFPRPAIAAVLVGAFFLFMVANAARDSSEFYEVEAGGQTAAPTTSIPRSPTPSVPVIPGGGGLVLEAWKQAVDEASQLQTVGPAALALINETAGKRSFTPCDRQVPPNGCFIGSAGSTVAVLGDSHSRMLLPMIRAALPDWQIQSYGEANCGWALIAFPNPGQERGNGPDEEICAENRSASIAKILLERPALIMLSENSQWVIDDPRKQEWIDGMNATLDALEALSPSTNIMIFGEVPRSRSMEVCLRGNSISGCAGEPVKSRWVRDQQRIVAEAHSNVTFIDAEEWMCTATTCPAVIDDIPVFSDGSHFTSQFSERLSPVFQEFLGR